jgi:thiol:disulfide interchange protein DsbD
LKDVDEAYARAREERKVLLVDAYADWCTACKELDHETFSSPDVMRDLKSMVLLKLDLTENNDKTKALRQRFAIMAMPTVILIGLDETELVRFSGFKNPKDFLRVIQKAGIQPST